MLPFQALEVQVLQIQAVKVEAMEVRNTISANRAIAATMMKDPTIGAAMKDFPFSNFRATPAENRIALLMWSQPCTLARVMVPAAGTSRQYKPNRNSSTPPIRLRWRAPLRA